MMKQNLWRSSVIGIVALVVLLSGAALLWADPGDLDLTFGNGNGYVVTDIDYEDQGVSIAVDSNNRLVVTGNAEFSPDRGVIIRYNPDGSLDSSFGNDGIVSLILDSGATKGILDSSERIVIIGHQNIQGLIARFNPDGTPDLTFGTQESLSMPGSNHTMRSVSLPMAG